MKKKSDTVIPNPCYLYVEKKTKYPRKKAVKTIDYGSIIIDIGEDDKVLGVEFLEDVILDKMYAIRKVK